MPDPIETSGADGGRAAEATEGHRNPETYLGTARARYYANPGSKYVTGVQTFEEVEKPDRYFYTLGGTWNLKSDSITPAASEGASLTLNFRAAVVQLVASGAWRIEGYLPRWQYQGHSRARCSGLD